MSKVDFLNGLCEEVSGRQFSASEVKSGEAVLFAPATEFAGSSAIVVRVNDDETLDVRLGQTLKTNVPVADLRIEVKE